LVATQVGTEGHKACGAGEQSSYKGKRRKRGSRGERNEMLTGVSINHVGKRGGGTGKNSYHMEPRKLDNLRREHEQEGVQQNCSRRLKRSVNCVSGPGGDAKGEGETPVLKKNKEGREAEKDRNWGIKKQKKLEKNLLKGGLRGGGKMKRSKGAGMTKGMHGGISF